MLYTFKLLFSEIKEWLNVIFRYYWKPRFLVSEYLLFTFYLLSNPYRVCRRYFQHVDDDQVYGETPLTSFAQLLKTLELKEDDVLLDLGCGRGRLLFWARSFSPCQLRGVDCVPAFIRRARWISRLSLMPGIRWQCTDILDVDLEGASHIYLFGTTLSDDKISLWLDKLKALPSGVIVMTVSYSLLDYGASKEFSLVQRSELAYAWGNATVFIHQRC